MALGRPRVVVGHVHRPGARPALEDSFLIADDWSAFAVADGITRDRYQVSELRSGASRAAELFCSEVLRGLASVGDAESTLRSAFGGANRSIRNLNAEALGGTSTDFLDRDLFGCVGAAVILRDGTLHYGRVGDCRIALFTSSFEKVFETPDDLLPAQTYLSQQQFSSPQARKLFARSKLRNNPAAENHDGKRVGYGAMTGEESASVFYRFGSPTAEPGWYALLYSDGFAELLASAPFAREFGARVLADPGSIGKWLDDRYRSAPPTDDATVVAAAL